MSYVKNSTVINVKFLIAALLGLVVGMGARSLYNSKQITTVYGYGYDYPPKGYGQSPTQTVTMPLDTFDIVVVIGLVLLAVIAIFLLAAAALDVYDDYLVPAWRRRQADKRDRSALVRAQLDEQHRKAHKRRVAAAKKAEAMYAGDLDDESNTDGLPDEFSANDSQVLNDERLIEDVARLLASDSSFRMVILRIRTVDESTTDESATDKPKVNTKKAPHGNEVAADQAEQVEGQDESDVRKNDDAS